jgi:ATP-dependent protease Clp ATPase subunit
MRFRYDVKVKLTDDALWAIVDYAIDRRLGARGLRGILEETLHDLLFDAPDRRGETITVDGAWVKERLDRLGTAG